MLLLTGATGTIGRPLLRRLTAGGYAVRCLVRDPRRLGPERVRVQIVLGDLGDPGGFPHALRGVETVVHLAAAIRDQPSGSIEELAGVATWRLVRAAEQAGVRRIVFFSALGASLDSPARLLRAKAVAERAVGESALAHTIFAPSIVYSPGDPYLTLLRRLALLPVMPISGAGQARSQPLWAEDVAACVMAALPDPGQGRATRYELAGPETLTYRDIVGLALGSFGRERPVVSVPLPAVRSGLRLLERLAGSGAFATWDEAELMELSLTSARGGADVEGLGVHPRTMASVLGLAA